MTRTMVLALAAYSVGLAAITWLSYDLYAKRLSSIECRTTFEECTTLVAQIQSFRKQESRASLTPVLLVDLTAIIERAARDAQILPKLIRSISPLPEERTAASPYRIDTVDVVIDDVELPKLLDLAERLQDAVPGLVVTGIDLVAPSGKPASSSSEVWRSQIRLTQLVYVPITAAESGTR